jgi:3-methyl-2-oxobutanoate hydroxymethyltransferase
MFQLPKITPQDLIEYKKAGERFACLTAYDTPSARIAEQCGIEVVLVGDSVGTTVLGLENTTSVTFENILYHTRAVKRGLKRSLLVSDLPLEASRGTPKTIAGHAKRLMKEGGAEAVKIEGPVFEAIEAMVASKIPVLAHLGLTPQTAARNGGFKVRAKMKQEAEKLLRDAKKVEACGAFALVLECIPWQLAKIVKTALKIPVIGIGAGPETDAQILVWHDILGFEPEKKLKFVRRYLNFAELAEKAVSAYREDVLEKKFPSLQESFTMKEEDFPDA